MFRWLNLLLLLSLIDYIESSESFPRSVTGEQGGNVTLSCEFKDGKILDIALSRFSKIIPIYPNEKDGRVFKNGSCDVIIKDLRFSDAGKYFLSVYYTDDQRELERRILEYQLDIHESGSKEEKNSDDKPIDTEQYTVESWIIVLSVIGALVSLQALIIFIIKKRQHQHWNREHDHYQNIEL